MNLPIRIVRASALVELRNDAASVPVWEEEANKWHKLYLQEVEQAKKSKGEQGRQLAELRRQLAEANERAGRANDEWNGMRAVLAQSDGSLRQARKELAAQRAEFEALVAEVRVIKAAAEDEESGGTVRAAIALGFLRSIVEEARAHDRDLGRFDLVAAVLFGRDGEQTAVDEEHAYAEDLVVPVLPVHLVDRYRTPGGSTVDVAADERNRVTVAYCGGCTEHHRAEWRTVDYHGRSLPLGEVSQEAETKAREWAEKHAADCTKGVRPS